MFSGGLGTPNEGKKEPGGATILTVGGSRVPLEASLRQLVREFSFDFGKAFFLRGRAFWMPTTPWMPGGEEGGVDVTSEPCSVNVE